MCLNSEGLVPGAGSALPPKKVTPCLSWASGSHVWCGRMSCSGTELPAGARPSAGPWVARREASSPPPTACLASHHATGRDGAVLHGAQPQTQGVET